MITPQDVQHIAGLARIELTPEEQQKFEKELSTILDFIGKLTEVDTSNVEPAAGKILLKNIMRADEQVDKNLEGKSAELVEATPEKAGRWISVKSIFENL